MNIEFLNGLSADDVINNDFPIGEILENSLYYPASGIDGSPIRNWDLEVNSFVYVDMSINRDFYINELSRKGAIRGYSLLAIRNLTINDLVSNDYKPRPPSRLNRQTYQEEVRRAETNTNNTFAVWSIFERNPCFEEAHGSKRFSLLHVRGEGVATYQALYQSNNLMPKIIASIRSGEGTMGGNYDGYSQILLDTLKMHPRGLPEMLLLWHRVNQLTVPEPWGNYYEPIVGSAFAKDDDPGFEISVLKRISL